MTKDKNIRGFSDGVVCSMVETLNCNLTNGTPQDLVNDAHTDGVM
jgi:hypothetical protein